MTKLIISALMSSSSNIESHSDMPHISIVSPEYKGAGMVHELVSRIEASLKDITADYEIILVNDASPDNTWEVIREVCAVNKKVKGINLSRNFGENYAITAGLSFAKGDYVIVMDCDLQNRPEDIPALYAKAQEGYDIVYAQRMHKQFSIWRRMASRMYHGVFQWLSGIKQDSSIAEFGIYARKVIETYNRLPEAARSFGSLVATLGFKSTAIPVAHADRGEGESAYSFGKLMKIASDVILSNSNKPLKIAVNLGLIIVSFSVLLIIYSFVEHFVAVLPAGFSSTFISIWFLGGLNILILGVVGLYIDKIFNQVKGRPLFIVSETLNTEEQ